MTTASSYTLGELYALEEMDAFLRKAQEKCRSKVAHRRFAGMETDDIVQEVLLKVYRSMQSYDGTLAKVSTYVDHVMDNMIRDCLRKAGSKANLSVVNACDLAAGMEAYRCGQDGEKLFSFTIGSIDPGFERVELWIDLMEHMQLNKQECEVFRLRTAGFDFVEIAATLGVSKARISQIWKSIKTKYMSL